MNKLIINLLILATAMMGLTACESDVERQARLDREHQVRMAKIQAGMNPDRTTVVYTNHGYRTHGGLYNDPYYDNIYAHRNSYAEDLLLAASIGYVASAFTPTYEPRTRVVVVNGVNTTQYVDKKGNTISKAEYDRRQAQSAKDKAAHQAKEKERLNKWKSDPKNKDKFKAKDKAARDAKAKKASVNKPKSTTKATDKPKQSVTNDKSKTQKAAPQKQKTDYEAKKKAEQAKKAEAARKAQEAQRKKEAAKKAYMKKQAQQKKAKKKSWGGSSKSYKSSYKKR